MSFKTGCFCEHFFTRLHNMHAITTLGLLSWENTVWNKTLLFSLCLRNSRGLRCFLSHQVVYFLFSYTRWKWLSSERLFKSKCSNSQCAAWSFCATGNGKSYCHKWWYISRETKAAWWVPGKQRQCHDSHSQWRLLQCRGTAVNAKGKIWKQGYEDWIAGYNGGNG